MKKILLLAEEGERKLIQQVAERYQVANLLSQYKVLITGVGGINIIRALHDLPRDTEILNIGYVGSANFNIGSMVEVVESRLNHPTVTYPEPVLTLQPLPFKVDIQGATCYTNTDFIQQSDYRDCVFDMELAFIAAMGFEHISALKIVSDNLSLHAYHEVACGVE